MQINFAKLNLDNAGEETYQMPNEETYINITEQLCMLRRRSD